MKWSHAFIPTLREDPKDAEAISHKLMMRAGMIRRLGSGAYSYLPLGVRVLQRVVAIIREEMTLAGAQECLLPALQPLELWKTTGRDRTMGDVLIRFKDRTGKDVVLGPTHEEVITSLVAEVTSHRQLPMTLYQIQTKFRDEPRPRSGVIRSKEFLMKDAYSFDLDAEGLGRSYQRMFEAYQRIFERCGLAVMACEADTGAMGGDVSHEFMAESPMGEDIVVRCDGCGYAANREAAKCHLSPVTCHLSPEQPKPLEEVKTPGRHTVEQVSTFLKVAPSRLIKTLLYEAASGTVAVLVRGDHDVNESKLARALNIPVRLAGAATIERVTGAPVGFTGPVKLSGVKLVADPAALGVVNAVTGANQAETHLVNVNAGRDFRPDVTADVRMVTPEDLCARCGKPLRFVKAIEVGHVFKLGTKYSQALGAMVQDAGGKPQPMIMGCYGIGINRIVASVIEQRHDANGILWPASIAPFDVIVNVLEPSNAKAMEAGGAAAALLEQAGRAVLLDDREQSPGSKFKDADLIGVPVQVVIGNTWQAQGLLELASRATKVRQQVEPEKLVVAVEKLLAQPPIQAAP